MQPHKIVYYDDPLNDDFAGNGIDKKPLPKKFKYVHKNPFYWFGSLLVYWLIAKPILWLVGKIGYGIRVQGKKNLRKIRLSGCKRSYIIADRDAMSIQGVRTLVQMIGCLPVPESPKEHEGFVDAIHYHIAKRHGIVIYPEAHIWPYSTRIRPFTDASFVYPSELGAPVVPFCVTYRKRKFRHIHNDHCRRLRNNHRTEYFQIFVQASCGRYVAFSPGKKKEITRCGL